MGESRHFWGVGKHHALFTDPFLIVILVLYGFLLFHISGDLSLTLDEEADLGIVNCLVWGKSVFDCNANPVHTRFPFYLHALVQIIAGCEVPVGLHYNVSAFFALLNLVLTYAFARYVFGLWPARLTVALFSTSAPLLASGRMLLAHSNVIATTFSILFIWAAYAAIRSRHRRYYLFLSAVLWGLCFGSSPSGLFLLFFLVLFWGISQHHFFSILKARPDLLRSCGQPAVRLLAWLIVAMLSFFLSTVIYIYPSNALAFWEGLSEGHFYGYWNYLNRGEMLPPWWFSILTFFIKLTPPVAGLFLLSPLFLRGKETARINGKFTRSIYLFVLTVLLSSSGIFAYDTPHHQYFLYPFVYMITGKVLYEMARQKGRQIIGSTFVCFALAIPALTTWIFFPNLLFQGAEYGESFIGELYGPAVIQAQGSAGARQFIQQLISKDPNTRILVFPYNSLRLMSPQVLHFSRESVAEFDYAYADYVHLQHLIFPNQKEYISLLKKRCPNIAYRYYFPLGYSVYEVWKCTG